MGIKTIVENDRRFEQPSVPFLWRDEKGVVWLRVACKNPIMMKSFDLVDIALSSDTSKGLINEPRIKIGDINCFSETGDIQIAWRKRILGSVILSND